MTGKYLSWRELPLVSFSRSLTEKQKGLFLGVVAVVLFSLTLPVSAYVTKELDPWFVGLGRTAFAGLIALSILWVNKVSLPSKRQLGWMALSALGVTLGFPVSISVAMSLTEASRGIIVIGITPLVTALLGAMLAQERMSKLFWVCAVLGALVVFVFTTMAQSASVHVADWLLLVAVITAGFGYATGGRISKELPGWQVICWTLVLAMPFLWIPTYLLFPASITSISLNSWLGFAYLAIVSQLFGFFLWNTALAKGGIAYVSQTQLLQVFFSLMAASWLFGEELNSQIWLFAGLVVAIVALGNFSKTKG